MQALILDEHIEDHIRRVVKYAEQHPVTIDEVLDMYNGELPPVGEADEHVCFIPMNYRAVFSIEDQAKFHVRHLSVSINAPGKLPAIEVIVTLLPLFGFEKPLQDCMVRLEKLPSGQQAVNVWEIIDDKETIAWKQST